MTHDICLGSDANVILTCTSEEAANAIGAVIHDHRDDLFQASDLEVYLRETDRDRGGEAHDLVEDEAGEALDEEGEAEEEEDEEEPAEEPAE